MIFSRDFYKKMHDYFHPRVHDCIQKYNGDEDLFMIPRYHECSLKNKKGAKKLINYRNGEYCNSPAWSNGKDFNDNCNKGPLTRYMSFYGNGSLLKNKGQTIFDYRTNQFDHLLDTPNTDNFERFFQIKDLHLKSDYK